MALYFSLNISLRLNVVVLERLGRIWWSCISIKAFEQEFVKVIQSITGHSAPLDHQLVLEWTMKSHF